MSVSCDKVTKIREIRGIGSLTLVRGGGWAGFEEVVFLPLLSKGGQGEQQMGAPWGKRVAKKKPTMVLVITLLVYPYVARKKNPIKVC